jgi:hypothetical protein
VEGLSRLKASNLSVADETYLVVVYPQHMVDKSLILAVEGLSLLTDNTHILSESVDKNLILLVGGLSRLIASNLSVAD